MANDKERRVSNARGETARNGTVEDPLEFIVEDHMREREICALIDRLAALAPVHETERLQMIDFLLRDLPLHLQDEEIDLFPLMLARCEPEDEIDKVIRKLLADHQHARADAPQVAALIDLRKSNVREIPDEDAQQLKRFADQSRRHLILENAVILPIARARLTDKDLALMKRHMLQRRGKSGPPTTTIH